MLLLLVIEDSPKKYPKQDLLFLETSTSFLYTSPKEQRAQIRAEKITYNLQKLKPSTLAS